ncbi:MAG: hypothetical protein AAF726_20490 [Planctomycetota bacterium]
MNNQSGLTGVPVMGRVGASLVATSMALLLALAVAATYDGAALDNMLWEGALIATAGWLVVGLPAALRYGGSTPLPGRWLASLLGALVAAIAVVVLALVVAVSTAFTLTDMASLVLMTSPLTVIAGIVAGSVHRRLTLRLASDVTDDRLRSSARMLARGIGSMVLIGVVLPFSVWPILERVAPYRVYTLASGASRERIERGVIGTVRVGDSLDSVQERLPWKRRPIQADTRGIRGMGWEVWFEDGRVALVHLDESP